MILHFLKRDFVDHLLGWIFILVITGLAILVSHTPVGLINWPILFIVYYFFATTANQHTLGSVWRTQHLLSRHYLLSLPASHKKLFLTLQIRILVFWLPFLTLACLFPLIVSGTGFFTVETWILYYFGLFTSVVTVIHTGIWSALEMERISSYLPKRQRLWANIKLFAVMMGPLIILYLAWADLLSSVFAPAWPSFRQLRFFKDLQLARAVFAGALLVLIFWIPRNARRWCVTP